MLLLLHHELVNPQSSFVKLLLVRIIVRQRMSRLVLVQIVDGSAPAATDNLVVAPIHESSVDDFMLLLLMLQLVLRWRDDLLLLPSHKSLWRTQLRWR